MSLDLFPLIQLIPIVLNLQIQINIHLLINYYPGSKLQKKSKGYKTKHFIFMIMIQIMKKSRVELVFTFQILTNNKGEHSQLFKESLMIQINVQSIL